MRKKSFRAGELKLQSASAKQSFDRRSLIVSGIDGWKNLEFSVRTWVIVVCAVVAFWFFLSFLLAFCCGPKFVECHLCEEPIPRR